MQDITQILKESREKAIPILKHQIPRLVLGSLAVRSSKDMARFITSDIDSLQYIPMREIDCAVKLLTEELTLYESNKNFQPLQCRLKTYEDSWLCQTKPDGFPDSDFKLSTVSKYHIIKKDDKIMGLYLERKPWPDSPCNELLYLLDQKDKKSN